MLNVQAYLLDRNDQNHEPLAALEALKEDFGIKHSIWEDQLVVLNYCQIESPKTHDITLECRSLVLELGTWEVVSRSFDRFFNLGELGEVTEGFIPTPFDGMSRFRNMAFHEKMDGSLIGIFNYKGQWLYRTRSVIMPVAEVNGKSWVTWKELIEEATNFPGCCEYLDSELTYILEVVSRDNRVVVDYEGRNAYLLGIRDKNGKYR